MSEDIEYVLLNKKECFVYNVPPATSASGYKAADWSNCIWKGRLQVCAKGDILIIKLLDASSGAIFAACPIPPQSPIDKIVERTVDSSRYFVLTMTDKTGRKAFLGMGFDDRNDAFDFNATLQDFRRQKDTPQEIIKPVIQIQPAIDLSLKDGQKISVNLKPLRPPTMSGNDGPATLPPPPASRSRASDSQGASNLIGVGNNSPPKQVQPSTFVTGSLLD
jgi:hypothetical protein